MSSSTPPISNEVAEGTTLQALTSDIRRSVSRHVGQLRRRLQLNKLWLSVLRSLLVSVLLLGMVILLTVLVAVVFYLVNRNGHRHSEKYQRLMALSAEFNDSLRLVLKLSKTAKVFENSNLTRQLMRLRQLGQNYAYKNVKSAISHHELEPNFSLSMHYAVTMVSLIGYGNVAGASELHYFCASLCMLIVVPVWYMYHYQLYHLFYFLQLYCHRRWIQLESQSNHTMMALRAIRIRNADIYKRSRFYLSNLALMFVMFPLCLAVFAAVNGHLSLSDKLWLTVQSIFHIGLGDIPDRSMTYWPVTFFMISTCFLIYFQCFSFILVTSPSMRLSGIARNDFAH